ncbi:MAG TPA: YceI family protein [Pseudonocardiaceae bacterium]|nr:YceI family protein [Pseudonocardiaceae bacterium]
MSIPTTGSAPGTAVADLSGHYIIDPTHSRLGFVARHAMVTKVRGSFMDFAGSFDMDASDWSASKAQATIQVASVDTGNEQRDSHLRANDFFDVPNYPKITFTSTRVEQTAEGTFAVTGDLTIKGITKPVTIELVYTGSAVDPFGNSRIGFEGTTTINRKDFGVNFNATLDTGGVLVSDKITLELDISAIKAK